MFKRIIAILLLLCLTAGTASAVFNPYSFSQTTTPSIPSFDAYMGKYVSAGRTETKSYLIYRKYSGRASNIIAVAEQYINMLQETFKFELIDKQALDFGNYARITYSFELDTRKDLSTFYISNTDDEPAWKTPDSHVILQYTISDSDYAYVHLYYSPELKVVDHSEMYAPPGQTPAPTPRKNYSKPTATPDTESSASY